MRAWLIFSKVASDRRIEAIVDYGGEFGYAFAFTKENEERIPNLKPHRPIWDINFVHSRIQPPISDGDSLEELIGQSEQSYIYLPVEKAMDNVIRELFSFLNPMEAPEIERVLMENTFDWNDLAKLFNEIATPLLTH